MVAAGGVRRPCRWRSGRGPIWSPAVADDLPHGHRPGAGRPWPADLGWSLDLQIRGCAVQDGGATVNDAAAPPLLSMRGGTFVATHLGDEGNRQPWTGVRAGSPRGAVRIVFLQRTSASAPWVLWLTMLLGLNRRCAGDRQDLAAKALGAAGVRTNTSS